MKLLNGLLLTFHKDDYLGSLSQIITLHLRGYIKRKYMVFDLIKSIKVTPQTPKIHGLSKSNVY